MFRYNMFALLCALLMLSNIDIIQGRKFGRRYGWGPGGNNSYPSSGDSSHGYPSSRNWGYRYQTSNGSNSAEVNTTVYHHYHYSPPQQIIYPSPQGGPSISYPVYHGTPPTYVYQYKDSGSKYGTLLAGLALMNLGILGSVNYTSSLNNYKPKPAELCKFGLKKDNGDYEEAKIDCKLISSFILAEQAKTQNQPTNTSVVATTVTNTTIVNTTNPAPEAPQMPGNVTVNVTYTMIPDGTLVPENMSFSGTANVTTESPPAPVVNALDVKDKPVEVTPGMECYVMRKTPYTSMKKSVPCGLLQGYADKSIKANSEA